MKLVIILIIFGLVALVSGCYRDVINPGSDPNGPPQDVSFSGDLLPLFNKNCGSAGCHDAAPAHKPSLIPEKAFSAIISGGYVNTAVPTSSPLYLVVKSGEMPPSGGLKASDAQKILDWIRNGAPNN